MQSRAAGSRDERDCREKRGGEVCGEEAVCAGSESSAGCTSSSGSQRCRWFGEPLGEQSFLYRRLEYVSSAL